MTDTTLTLPGVFWVLVCAVSTAGYLLLMKTLQNDPQNKMGDAAMLMVNNCCALPLMLLSWGFSGEIQALPHFKQIADAKFWMFLVLTASQACLLNYCIFLCNRKNSPITTSITGTVKDLVTNSFGLFIFGDVEFNVYNLSSIALCFSAACWCVSPFPHCFYVTFCAGMRICSTRTKCVQTRPKLQIINHRFDDAAAAAAAADSSAAITMLRWRACLR
jgi:hypothetical protein